MPVISGGGLAAGTSVLRKFSLAFNTPSILTGATVYTPTVGDVIIAAWVRVTTIWDGTTPTLGIGQYVNGLGSGWGASGATGRTVNVTQITGDYGFSRLSELSLFDGQGMTIPPLDTGWLLAGGQSQDGPAVITAANPIKVVVSQTGFAPQIAVAGSSGSATIPTTVTAGANDQFIFGGNVYTVAPGTYTTYQQMVNAMLAATHTGTPLSSLMRMVTDSFGDLDAGALVFGTALNGLTFNTGTHDFLAATGYANGDAFSSGTVNGGDPGSSQGAAVLYLLTATPR